jgi:hypothetical protein
MELTQTGSVVGDPGSVPGIRRSGEKPAQLTTGETIGLDQSFEPDPEVFRIPDPGSLIPDP